MISDAFDRICNESWPASGPRPLNDKCGLCRYVSLYADSPYYGGPEDGGWWGSDTILVAYQCYQTEEAAEAAKAAVEALARDLSDGARSAFGQKCREELEWLDARGLDADYLPEVDGEESYFVVIEESLGSLVSEGCRHYE